MSNAVGRKWSPFFLQQVTESLNVLKVTVKARAIKTRAIFLLEWAIMAPLHELNPRPTLEEIKHELGIAKIDFLLKIAGELETLGVIEHETDSQYRLSKTGEMLFQQKKMISDPREVHFPIFRETSSSEWFVGVDNLSYTENGGIIDETLNIPSYIPEEIIKSHVAQLKRLLKSEEEILDHEIDEIDQLGVDVKVNLFLTMEGLTTRVSEHPFGTKHNQLLDKILYDRFTQEGLMEKHLTNIRARSPHKGTRTTQIHQIEPDAKLFLPTDVDKVFNDFFVPSVSWIITNIENSPEIIQNQVKKPKIIVYLTKNESNSTELNLETTDKNNPFFPSFVQIQMVQKNTEIPDNTILAEEKLAVLTNVEVDGFELPLFLVKKASNTKDNRIAILTKILNKMEEHSFERNLAFYYLIPLIEALRSLLLTVPIQTITDHEKAERMILEILELRRHLETEAFDLALNTDLLDKILSYYSWEELVKFEYQQLLLNYNAFLTRLDQLLAEKLDVTLNGTWENFRESITKIVNVHKDLSQFKSTFQGELPSNIIERVTNALDHRLSQCIDCIESMQIRLPKPPDVNAYDDLFNELETVGRSSILDAYLNQLKDVISTGTFNFDPIEVLSIQAFLAKNNYAPTDKELKNLVTTALEGISLNFTEKDGIKILSQINALVFSINSDFSITKDVLKILPQRVEPAKDQPSIQNLITNLKGLHQVIGDDVTNYIKKIVKRVERSLQPKTFSELELWLLFLERVKQVLERPLGTTLIKMNTKNIWKRTVPYLEEDMEREKIIRNTLGQLKLGPQLRNWRNEKRKAVDERDKTNKKDP